jgi:hypothetical protein
MIPTVSATARYTSATRRNMATFVRLPRTSFRIGSQRKRHAVTGSRPIGVLHGNYSRKRSELSRSGVCLVVPDLTQLRTVGHMRHPASAVDKHRRIARKGVHDYERGLRTLDLRGVLRRN